MRLIQLKNKTTPIKACEKINKVRKNLRTEEKPCGRPFWAEVALLSPIRGDVLNVEIADRTLQVKNKYKLYEKYNESSVKTQREISSGCSMY